MVRIVEQEPAQSNKPLEYVFAAVQMPSPRGRAQNIFVGWATDGRPTLTANTRLLTPNAHEMLSGNVMTPFPFDAAQARFTPQAYEFAEMAQPIDNPDRGRQFTEDIVSISGTDGAGAVKFLQIEELDLLDAIMRGQIDWNIGGVKSYTLLIPDIQTETNNFMLFSPGDQPSNDMTYRTFLLKTIKTLTTIDRRQSPPDQKGYMAVLRAVVANLEAKAAARKAEKSGLERIALDLGIMQEAESGASNQLAYLNVDQLRYVIGKFQEVVTQSFIDGKQV